MPLKNQHNEHMMMSYGIGREMGIKTLLALILFSLMIVGTMDYQDAQAREDLYCKMLGEGSWPAYDDSIVCED